MQISPISDRVVISRLDVEEITPGGLHIPETGKEKPSQGLVIAVGPGSYQIQVGDKIAFGKYSGIEIEIDGETLLILREEDIFGKLV
jgi:chaperonin GroES